MTASILFTLTLLFSESQIARSEEIEAVLKKAPASAFVTGKDIYERHCIKCHAPSNIMVSSPKLGDRNEWQKRLMADRELKDLVKAAMKGKNAMPKKGMCTECKEKEIESAILYMIHAE